MADINTYLKEAEVLMEKAFSRTLQDLAKVRTGKANPSLLDDLQVNYYGAMTPLNQVASITTPDPRSILIKPWEKSLIAEIEKSIMAANLGLTPQNDGQQIMINVPMLTEERRRELVKQVAQECERGRVSIRGVRKEVNEKIHAIKGTSEDEVKGAEERTQKLTNDFIKKIDDLLKNKEAQIMKV